MERICCFAGHKELYNTDKVYSNIKIIAETLIVKENVKEFWVGNYGLFDKLAAKVIRTLKESYPEIQLNLVIPYLTTEINQNKEQYYKNYDAIMIADIPDNTPMQYRIVHCNRYMVQNASYMICYVKKGWGGASKTLEYAQKQEQLKIWNIGEFN